jgi:hypothetical protein
VTGKKKAEKKSRTEPDGHDLGVLLDAVALRLNEASSAAERAVEAIEVEAVDGEPDSDTPESERARIESELTQTLVARLNEIVRQCGQLAEILHSTSRSLGSGAAGAAVEADAASVVTAGATVSRPAPVITASGQPISDGVRLITTQMAVAGSSREEIQKRLGDEFGVTDADEVVDVVLGPIT